MFWETGSPSDARATSFDSGRVLCGDTQMPSGGIHPITPGRCPAASLRWLIWVKVTRQASSYKRQLLLQQQTSPLAITTTAECQKLPWHGKNCATQVATGSAVVRLRSCISCAFAPTENGNGLHKQPVSVSPNSTPFRKDTCREQAIKVYHIS